ncbi:MAG: hypothetical protein R3C10_14255 [Pirellulales bacterium]
MMDKLLYRFIPALIAIVVALVLLPATSPMIRQALNDWFAR